MEKYNRKKAVQCYFCGATATNTIEDSNRNILLVCFYHYEELTTMGYVTTIITNDR